MDGSFEESWIIRQTWAEETDWLIQVIAESHGLMHLVHESCLKRFFHSSSLDQNAWYDVGFSRPLAYQFILFECVLILIGVWNQLWWKMITKLQVSKASLHDIIPIILHASRTGHNRETKRINLSSHLNFGVLFFCCWRSLCYVEARIL